MKPMLLRRILAAAVLVTAAACAASQDVILQSRPDVIITVTKSAVGPDYVDVKMVREDYPADLLEAQCRAVAEFVGSTARGLDIAVIPTGASPGGTAGQIMSARFATDNLIDQQEGILRLEPIAKAFAGAPEPFQIGTLAVIFSGQKPTSATLAEWDGPSATISANFDEYVPQVEYRVVLKTQDPDAITIPSRAGEQTIPAELPSNGGPRTTLIIWVVLAALAAGVLVYFALRPARKGKRGSESGRPR